MAIPGRIHDTGVTARAIVLALALILSLALAGFYLELVTKLAYVFSTMVPPLAPLGALNPVVARRWAGLRRRALNTLDVSARVRHAARH
jgi:hypothetical protein